MLPLWKDLLKVQSDELVIDKMVSKLGFVGFETIIFCVKGQNPDTNTKIDNLRMIM